MKSPFFLTTAIDYTNGAPHIGHAYEKVLADVLARYHRLAGDDVFLLTGVDQHGQKVQQSAEREGLTPAAFVGKITAQFVSLWDVLGIRRDGWAATTDAKHQACVRALLTRLWEDRDPATGDSRWIYRDKRAGYYSVRQEQFLTDKERGPDGEFGPEWGEVEFREEENYYFRLEPQKQWLLDLIDARSAAGRPLVQPEFRVAELRNAVEKLTGDLCISRPKSRLTWGIELPFDPDFVTFVWFDALVNYLSFAPGYDPAVGADLSEFRSWGPAVHLIGKDILIPAHGVYWPIMLRAIGFTDAQMPTFLVHGWWNIGGAKMSKSLGNSIDPDALARLYSVEAVRYYLMSDIATGRDADFSEERLVSAYNSALANNLGNLLHRTLSMAGRYRGGKLRRSVEPRPASDIERDYRQHFEAAKVSQALQLIFGWATSCNEWIEAEKPWALAKDSAQAEQLDALLYLLAESLRRMAILLAPVLPRSAHGIFDQLNWRMESTGEDSRFQLADLNSDLLPDGHEVSKPIALFPKIESKS
jgi:methionyl-tRNA synthetase